MKVVLCHVIDAGLNKVTDNIGIASIAAFLRSKNTKTDMTILVNDLENIENQLCKVDINAELYGFSLFNTTAAFIYRFSILIKKCNPKAKIYVGGRLATSSSDEIFSDQNANAIDYIVLGDGENPTYELAKALEQNVDVSQFKWLRTREDTQIKEANIECLKNLPLPARDFTALCVKQGDRYLRLSTSRGCLAHCAFCSGNSYEKEVQLRSAEEVFAELVNLYQQFNIRTFAFNDNSFEDPGQIGKDRIRKLCELLLEFPVRFSLICFLRAETFKENDQDLINLMRKAGFTQVFIGVESGCDEELRFYNKRATVEDNHLALNLFHKNSIDVTLGFIMFNPISTSESLKDNFTFLKEHQIYKYPLYISSLQIYHNTLMYKKAKKMNLLLSDYNYLTVDRYIYRDSYDRYIYRDSYVYQAFQLIQDISDKQLIDEDYRFNRWNRLYNSVFIFEKEDMMNYKDDIYEIRRKLSEALCDFFKIIYIDCDLKRAESEFANFKHNIMTIYRTAYKLNMRLLKNTNVKGLLLYESGFSL